MEEQFAFLLLFVPLGQRCQKHSKLTNRLMCKKCCFSQKAQQESVCFNRLVHLVNKLFLSRELRFFKSKLFSLL
jgi:hypothetical protein